MGRLHLFEFNDQAWLPDLLRDGETGYLEAISRKMGVHRYMAPTLREALERSGQRQIIDLCSGAAGPVGELLPLLPQETRVLLTDKYPNARAFAQAEQQEGIQAHPTPVDATSVPAPLRGLRTLFNALHHFQPAQARAILADAVKQQAPIVVFELSERSAANVLTAPLIPLFVWLFMPMVRPLRLGYLLLTYVLPLLPWLIAWDGLVSHLRAYSVQELEALTRGLDDQGYTWSTQRIPAMGGKAHITALTGMPAQA